MSPVLHLLRHGQGYHNTQPDGHSLRDPVLTQHGREQCAARCKAFTRHDQIELLLASPLRRTIQTCQICFAPCVERGLIITTLPGAEEASSDPCDTGSDVSVLKSEFPNVDLSNVHGEWFVHSGAYATTPEALFARAKELRCFVRARKEKEVVLVSHGFFNHYLTGDVNEKGEQTTGWWKEAEIRSFRFESEEDEEARIAETQESIDFRVKEVESEELAKRGLN